MDEQRQEGSDEILIFFPDESEGQEHQFVDLRHWRGGDETLEDAASERCMELLEAELNVQLDYANVGPTFDMPAFFTAVPDDVARLVPLARFFEGRRLVDNIEAWREVFNRLSHLFSRSDDSSRNGAAVAAVNAVFDELGGIPKDIKLRSYVTQHLMDTGQPAAGRDGQIDAAPRTRQLGMIKHVFGIEVGGVVFHVVVHGSNAEVKGTERTGNGPGAG